MKRLALPLAAVLLVAGVALALALRGRAPAEPRTVRMSMSEYAFNGTNPTLRFKPGERIHFIVTNDESTNVLHNFRIVGLNVECGPPMKPGETREVTVTMPKSGEFAYTCCTHPGMGGTMVVAKK
ncbi:MAG TPA: cupredoxin domain-containing protein [Candidatus Eisenbacteria bacterium]|nr:cupredoxin domain-containing protein [Candidatus Eisenbacteria bacterium]